MFGRKVFIRNDYWLTGDSFKKPEMYIGEVVSKKSKLNSRGKVEWMVELYDWKNSYYWISEDELARSKKDLNDRISKRKQKDDYEDNVFYTKRTVGLYKDHSWRRGCEIINETGKRKGKLCNRSFHTYKNNIKICKMHFEIYIDVTEDSSEYEEGENDDLEYGDFDFIAEEDDGTKIINGKRFVYQSDDYSSSSSDYETCDEY